MITETEWLNQIMGHVIPAIKSVHPNCRVVVSRSFHLMEDHEKATFPSPIPCVLGYQLSVQMSPGKAPITCSGAVSLFDENQQIVNPKEIAEEFASHFLKAAQETKTEFIMYGQASH